MSRMRTPGTPTACCFCAGKTEPLIAGRRTNAPDRAVCSTCAKGLKANLDGSQCDFCDHPNGAHAEVDGVRICAGCLDLARDIVRDSEAPIAGPETHLDASQLWSELTPAPVPVVDTEAPATAHADLALAFVQMGLVDEARSEVEKALAKDPQHPIALRVQTRLGIPRS
jgi:hypothetical protein